jgi:adenine-specific DNA-methyltransferase
MATKKVAKAKNSNGNAAKSYKHPEAESLMRPDVGTQAQFKKRKEPKKYRYDSSLSPALEYDGQTRAGRGSDPGRVGRDSQGAGAR